MLRQSEGERKRISVKVISCTGIPRGTTAAIRWRRGGKSGNSGSTTSKHEYDGCIRWEETVPIVATLYRTSKGYETKSITFDLYADSGTRLARGNTDLGKLVLMYEEQHDATEVVKLRPTRSTAETLLLNISVTVVAAAPEDVSDNGSESEEDRPADAPGGRSLTSAAGDFGSASSVRSNALTRVDKTPEKVLQRSGASNSSSGMDPPPLRSLATMRNMRSRQPGVRPPSRKYASGSHMATERPRSNLVSTVTTVAPADASIQNLFFSQGDECSPSLLAAPIVSKILRKAIKYGFASPGLPDVVTDIIEVCEHEGLIQKHFATGHRKSMKGRTLNESNSAFVAIKNLFLIIRHSHGWNINTLAYWISAAIVLVKECSSRCPPYVPAPEPIRVTVCDKDDIDDLIMLSKRFLYDIYSDCLKSAYQALNLFVKELVDIIKSRTAFTARTLHRRTAVNMFLRAAAAFDRCAISNVIRGQFFNKTLRFINVSLMNALFEYPNTFVFETAFLIKNEITALCDAIKIDPLMNDSTRKLAQVLEVSNLLCMNKSILLQEREVRELFPHLSPKLIVRILKGIVECKDGERVEDRVLRVCEQRAVADSSYTDGLETDPYKFCYD